MKSIQTSLIAASLLASLSGMAWRKMLLRQIHRTSDPCKKFTHSMQTSTPNI